MNHIELFAGCGGLCLGLQSEKFELLFANELSPMASETFAYNLLNENLDKYSKLELYPKNKLKTKWLSSQYNITDLAKRLRENPKEFPNLGKGNTDVRKADDFKENLIVGSVVQLNKWLMSNPAELQIIKNGFGQGEVDLVSGGPPCQSFSMAGMREYANVRNNLPREFANFVGMVRPRFALLENVTGILHPFEVNKKKIYAWFEVAKAFAGVGYVPLCLHVNARFVGVAQNRTRFLMVLFRKDVFNAVKNRSNESETELLEKSGIFFEKMLTKQEVSHTELPVFDVSRTLDLSLYKDSFLRHLVEFREKEYSVKEAIDDLRADGEKPSAYVQQLNEKIGKNIRPYRNGALDVGKYHFNNEHRKHNLVVQGRFRVYQVLQLLQSKTSPASKAAAREALAFLKGNTENLSDECAEELMTHTYFIDAERSAQLFSRRADFEEYLKILGTKKQTQKALDASVPAPAALAIPDDACHYHQSELRTLSVREMARIQSFPDNFVFRSKATTGGQQRKFEVPQYTQVGNAVPPMLGRAIGKMFNELSLKIQPKTKSIAPHRPILKLKNRELAEAEGGAL